MTNEEREIALYCLKASSDYHSEVCEECVKYPNCEHMIQDDVTETIIKALEQQPCEDCISREAVKDMLTETWTKYVPMELDVNLSFVLDKISELPSVIPQPKKGKWIEYCYQNLSCSNCGYIVADTDIDEYKYCPNCGAKMTESEE